MWKDNKTFQEIDSRIQLDEELSNKWKEKVYSDHYLHSSDDLFDKLWKKK